MLVSTNSETDAAWLICRLVGAETLMHQIWHVCNFELSPMHVLGNPATTRCGLFLIMVNKSLNCVEGDQHQHKDGDSLLSSFPASSSMRLGNFLLPCMIFPNTNVFVPVS